MDLASLLFPQQSQAASLRNISSTLTQTVWAADRGAKKTEAVTADLGLLTLLVMSTLRTLIDKGIVTQEEILAKIHELDALDGVKDGKLKVDAVRGSLGIPTAPPPKPQRSALESLNRKLNR